MTALVNRNIERRLFRIGAALVLAGSLLTMAFFGLRVGVSFLAGGILAAVNLTWFERIARVLIHADPKLSKRRMLTGLFLRLLLIPLSLYVMIRFLFLSVPAAVAGLTVFYCSVFVEGILEAFETTSK